MKNKIANVLNAIDNQNTSTIKQYIKPINLSQKQKKSCEQIFGNYRLVHNQFINLKKNDLFTLCNLTHLIQDFRTVDYLSTIDHDIIQTIIDYIPYYDNRLRKKNCIQFAICKPKDVDISSDEEYILLIRDNDKFYIYS